MDGNYRICLAGNPNTGKSSLFNKLTKLRQHTGNWHGKTVNISRGSFKHKGMNFTVADIPGTYSLFGLSDDERIARDYIFFQKNDIVIVVCDPSSLAKNLGLLFHIIQYHKNIILAVNFIDEAIKKDILINRGGLLHDLGIPVVFISAKKGKGLEQLKDTICAVVKGECPYNIVKTDYPLIDPLLKEIQLELRNIKDKEIISMRILDGDKEFFSNLEKYYPPEDMEIIYSVGKKYNNPEYYREIILSHHFRLAQNIVKNNVYYPNDLLKKTKKIDRVLTSPFWGLIIMSVLLFVVFFITIKLANYPTSWLYQLFYWIETKFLKLGAAIRLPSSVTSFLVFGVYRTLYNVVAVMLPPMAIFFPLFTFLEDLGFLPRIAFNLDHQFQKAGCHGKQCLTMCMGFGCNAAAIVGTRIITSPREKLLAIITNTFVPCNGRFPLIFTLAACFFTGFSSSFLNAIFPALLATSIILLGIITTFLVSYALSKTVLKGVPSTFALELPPYRRPNILQILHNSLISRTLLVMMRAVVIAAPLGGIIWILSHYHIGASSLLKSAGVILDYPGRLLGMDGIILLAFILGLPANEIVLPLIVMGYISGAYLQPVGSVADISHVLLANGWTVITAISVLLFSLLHYPCTTTLYTIYKETRSKKWTFLAFLIPTVLAVSVCLLVNTILKIML